MTEHALLTALKDAEARIADLEARAFRADNAAERTLVLATDLRNESEASSASILARLNAFGARLEMLEKTFAFWRAESDTQHTSILHALEAVQESLDQLQPPATTRP